MLTWTLMYRLSIVIDQSESTILAKPKKWKEHRELKAKLTCQDGLISYMIWEQWFLKLKVGNSYLESSVDPTTQVSLR